MQHSSRKSPCVICGRNTDDKCRRSETRILCYVGDSFSPPLSLKIGDTITVNGERWSLVSQQAGFSQNSFAFALDKGAEYRFLAANEKRTFRSTCISVTREFTEKMNLVTPLLSSLKPEDDFYSMNIDQFYANKKAAKAASDLLCSLIVFCTANKRHLVASGIDPDSVKEKFRATRKVFSAACKFETLLFDSPKPHMEDMRPSESWF